MDVLHSGLLIEKDLFYTWRFPLEDLAATLHEQKKVLYILDDPKSLWSMSEEEYA